MLVLGLEGAVELACDLASSGGSAPDVPDGCLGYGGEDLCEYECNGQSGSIECSEMEPCCGWCKFHVLEPNYGCARCLDPS